jgi:2-haloacid dehalogenase
MENLKALVFDVFGTVVDWRGSVIAEGIAWGKEKGLASTGATLPIAGGSAISPRWRTCAAAGFLGRGWMT